MNFIKNQRGQTAVEYVLLLAVVATLVFAVIRNNAFQSYLGKEGEFFKKYKAVVEYSYRYGLGGEQDPSPDYTKLHPSYFEGGDTRFFGPLNAYPR